ncbi:MAG: YbhB/YbcL family Raf kinase inhibitor-like protein [Patescibacteria group bacterium]|jgi:hypothetical protein
MRITSSAFGQNERIPSKYTCDGENMSPPLEFLDVPENAKSLVLLMDDPDVPKSVRPDGVWDHWVVFNIPPHVRVVSENENPPGVVGKNTRGHLAYGGPCPPIGQHRYFFKLFALDDMLDLNPDVTKSEVVLAMENHVIEHAELMGVYDRGGDV